MDQTRRRVERGITAYLDGAGVERFAVRLNHRGTEWTEEGFPTITKAQKWRESRKGRIAEGRLFPEQEAAVRAAGPLFTVCAESWLTTGKLRWKQSTVANNRSLVQTHLLPRFGAVRISRSIGRRCGRWRRRRR